MNGEQDSRGNNCPCKPWQSNLKREIVLWLSECVNPNLITPVLVCASSKPQLCKLFFLCTCNAESAIPSSLSSSCRGHTCDLISQAVFEISEESIFIDYGSCHRKIFPLPARFASATQYRKQMVLLTQWYSEYRTCLVAQTQPLHRTQLCPTAFSTDKFRFFCRHTLCGTYL